MDYIKYVRNMVGHEKIILVAVMTIIEKDGMILLQHRSDNNNWGLPGGCLEMNESIIEGGIREVKEETGLDIVEEELIGVFNNYNTIFSSGDRAHVVAFYFKGKVVGGELKKDFESLELKYFRPDEMPYIESIDNRKAIETYLKGLRNQIE